MSAADGVTDGVTPAGDAPRLRIVYRSHGGENDKSRPPYYSKLLALASVVRAARTVGRSAQLIYWNDGPMPGDRLDVMRATGDVVRIDGGSNRASYRAAIEMATTGGWPSHDLVWFAEDDYLYRPDAFRAVLAGAAAVPQADYLSVVGGRALDPASPRTATSWFPRRGAVDAPERIMAGGVTWFRGVSTTSTFGARLGVLREDRRLLRLLPYSGGAWDHTTCLAVQGRQPFRWEEVLDEVVSSRSRPPGTWPRSIARGAVRSGVNLRSLRLEPHRRTLYLCDPVGARHMELPGASDGVDWPALVDDTLAWAAGAGIEVRRRPAPSDGSNVVAS